MITIKIPIHEDYVSCNFITFYYLIFWRFKNSLKYHQSSRKLWKCVKNILQFVKSHTSYNCHNTGFIHTFCSSLMHECTVGFNKLVVFESNIKIYCWLDTAQQVEFHQNGQLCLFHWVCISHTIRAFRFFKFNLLFCFLSLHWTSPQLETLNSSSRWNSIAT
jgi:hypothetical protein